MASFNSSSPPAFAACVGAAGRSFALAPASRVGSIAGLVMALVLDTPGAVTATGAAERDPAGEPDWGIRLDARAAKPGEPAGLGARDTPARIRFFVPLSFTGLLNARIAELAAPVPKPTPKAATPVHRAMLPAV